MINIDLERGLVTVDDASGRHSYALDTPEAFATISEAWLRCGWDTKYVYGFSWLGRPIIQLPEDMVRIQEVIFAVKPDVLIETGVAHGGSLVFYASLFAAMQRGHVIGVDIEIRAHNRQAMDEHFLRPYITLLEGDSAAPEVVGQVRDLVKPGETVMVVLDSNHSKAHVLRELHAYADLVTEGSYVVATDGIMQSVVGAPRSQLDWSWNNPQTAVHEFLASRPDFALRPPVPPFNEGVVRDAITYWPNAWLQRIAPPR